MDRITARRRRHVTELRPLSFQSSTADLDVHTVSLFDDYDGSIAIALVTAIGTTTLRLPTALASDMANGVTRLVRQRVRAVG